MPTSRASAVWEGSFKEGQGEFEAKSGTFRGRYSYQTRFVGSPGTTPEELIAAAHASCVSMALVASLEKAGTPATRIATDAACTIDIVDGAAKITTIRLHIRGAVPGLDAAGFRQAAAGAKDNCPVSKALKGNVEVSLEATLET